MHPVNCLIEEAGLAAAGRRSGVGLVVEGVVVATNGGSGDGTNKAFFPAVPLPSQSRNPCSSPSKSPHGQTPVSPVSDRALLPPEVINGPKP